MPFSRFVFVFYGFHTTSRYFATTRFSLLPCHYRFFDVAVCRHARLTCPADAVIADTPIAYVSPALTYAAR